ncbi:CO dehydrogenase/acetyl-CoA synthase delta subunit [Alkaliphilus metalliredigens QYMF]|uniref:CO dehydrogenase/acetyl-CoA synthase delta subunit n=1 Tax=Alkaliphilus metalliredigens (strain QYMF) TaxID=293826 RepID=A6TPR9_ALKMQ|nr:acetyl-CoA decarbonylase/synthase complex subunit delta [Alkaliphilus metalliredigens]ABR48187.1 CO dehydrogenase/acetyl-CoA synthase delta subunit [Alkaliphilus metalliredigens QYMF]
MPFKMSVQDFKGKINEVEIGKGEKAIKIGGQKATALYHFDNDAGNAPKIGIEITDIYPEEWIASLKELYKDVANDPAAWAKFVEEKLEPDFICLRFEGSDPNGLDKSPEECAEVAKAVVEAISIPLVIAGTQNHDKDAKIFEKITAAVDGHNCLFLAATEENYKTVGASAGLAYKHKVGAESSVDINLAKQLNVLLDQLGVKNEDITMHIGCSAVGYGFEYLISTVDRIRLAALGQNDKTLQMPIITPVSFETWTVKESIAEEEDAPEWGSREERAISIEISTATSIIAVGADAVIVRHPKSLETLKNLTSQLA